MMMCAFSWLGLGLGLGEGLVMMMCAFSWTAVCRGTAVERWSIVTWLGLGLGLGLGSGSGLGSGLGLGLEVVHGRLSTEVREPCGPLGVGPGGHRRDRRR